ncbi:integrase catalytic domain-containing protein [Trichonephila clavipes]|nr:integrase catalytic domain-containing protein [Trichonephila clavipes]
MSRNPGSGVKTDGRNRGQTVCTWRQERNSSNVFVVETKTNCVLLVNKIIDLIPNKVIDVDINVSEFVPLADDKLNIPDRIDMLLGAEIFYELLKPGKFYCDNSHLVLQNTVFGYVVSGSVDHTHTHTQLQRIAFIAD